MRRVVAASLAPLLAFAATAAAAQEETTSRITGARLATELAAAGSDVRVAVTYDLDIEPGAATLPVRGVAFLSARLEDVTATVDGAPVPFELDVSREPRLEGEIALPDGPSDGGAVELELRYAVRGATAEAASFDIAVPLLLIDVPPAAAPDDFFTVQARFPDDHALVEAFPTVPRQRSEHAGVARYTFDLQVVPGMVRYRGRIGDPPLITFGRAVDAATVAVILVLCVAGYRGMTRSRTSTAEGDAPVESAAAASAGAPEGAPATADLDTSESSPPTRES